MLEKIKKKLEKLGYNSYVRLIDDQECLYSFIEGKINSVFFIKNKSGEYLLEYFTGQIPVENEFKSESDLIDYIKQKFPID